MFRIIVDKLCIFKPKDGFNTVRLLYVRTHHFPRQTLGQPWATPLHSLKPKIHTKHYGKSLGTNPERKQNARVLRLSFWLHPVVSAQVLTAAASSLLQVSKDLQNKELKLMTKQQDIADETAAYNVTAAIYNKVNSVLANLFGFSTPSPIVNNRSCHFYFS